MSRYEELIERLDKTRIYLVGSNEWTEMMTAMYVAVDRCLSISVYDNAESIIAMMEREIEALNNNVPDMYTEQIRRRKATYRRGEPFEDGDDWVEPV